MIRRFLFLFAGWLGMSASLGAQHTYYVSPAGNDSWSGSINAPWRHVQYGLNRLSGGDTLVLLDGVYNEKIHIPVSGITLRARHPRQAVLDGTGLVNQTAMIAIESKSHILIEGLEIRNNLMNDAQGIAVEGAGTGIRIWNCYVHDIHFSADPSDPVTEQTNAQAIVIYGTRSQAPYSRIHIRGNEIARCRLGYSEGIALNGNVTDFVISDNDVHDLTNIGIDLIGHEGTCPVDSLDAARQGRVEHNRVSRCLAAYDTSAGIYVDGGRDIVIMYNLLTGNGYGLEVGCENAGFAATGIRVRNNFILHNAEAGMALGGYDYPAGSGKVSRCEVAQNTFYLNDSLQTGTGSLFVTYAEDCSIRNNLFVTASDELMYTENRQPGLILNANLYYDTDGDDSDNSIDWDGETYYGLADFRRRTSYEILGFYANPHLQTDSTGLPRLTAASPLDTGDASYVPLSGETDYFGQERLVGSAPDNGAEEWQNLVVPHGRTGGPVYPNPFDNILFLPDTATVYYRLADLHGRILQTGRARRFIRTGFLPRGVYLLFRHQKNQPDRFCRLIKR